MRGAEAWAGRSQTSEEAKTNVGEDTASSTSPGEGERRTREEVREREGGKGERIERNPKWFDGSRRRVICRHMPTTIFILLTERAQNIWENQKPQKNNIK